MANIDDKVVSMSFEGSKFESGVRTTLSALDKLKAALQFPNAGKGLDQISQSAKRVDMGFLARGIENVKNALNTLRLVGIGVMTHIANAAVDAGARMIKSLTLDPIKQGLSIYETKLQSIQTVLANTSAQGTKMADVTKALQELNKYSNLTIYNFGQMAKNIGTFTAAGVDLNTAVASIKGIANLAALSGSSADQASMAMYQLSQAIAAGQVKLQDWNSVVNAGLGGAVFQKALANTAEAMGKLKDGAVQTVGPMKQLKINGESFRQSIGGPGPKWLTSDVLTNTLKQFTGDMSEAQLKAQGFNAEQIKSIQQTAKIALHAATQVKTIGQVFDIAKETAATGWANTFEIIFGGLNEAKATFTGLSNAINNFIQTNADARNKVLADWKTLGGRKVLIEGIKSAFKDLGDIIRPIKDAFRDIFPAATGKNLYDLTVRFKQLMDALRPSQQTMDNIRSTFRGLFAVLDIGVQIIKGVFAGLKELFSAVGGGNGSILKFTGSLGDFLVALDKALKQGDVFRQLFVKMGAILSVPLNLVQRLAGAIANLFSGFSPGGFSGKMSSITKATEPFKKSIDGIVEALKELGPAIAQGLGSINWDTVLSVVQTGLFGGLVFMIKDFIGGTNLRQLFGIMGKNFGRNFGAGVLGNISKAFGGLSGTLSAMQNELKARTLEEIAVAIALLAASVLALSLINPDKLGGALGGLTVMIGELIGAMALMDKLTTMKSFVKLPVIAASLILLAGAIDLLTLSVLALSRLSWEQLTKGLIGVGGLLVGLSAASTVLSKNAGGMIRSGIGIMGIAVAMKILASAMKDFGNMNWIQIAKGLVGVAGGLAAIATTMQLMPKGMLIRSAAIVAIAAALEIIANVVSKFGGMNWGQIDKGLAGVGASLVVIAAAMQLMPANMILTAAGLLLVAASLGKIESAVAKMGGMSIKQIAKGLIGLAAALGILAAALILMSGAVSGAIALGIAASGLSLLAGALALIGRQSWTSLLKGLIGLAASIAIIAGAAILLTPAIPALLGFGAALVVIGAGLALAGAGIALIGVGLSAIAVAGTASVRILVDALESLVASLVDIAKNLVLGVLQIVKTFADMAPAFVVALGKIINNLLQVIINAAPKIGQAFQALLDMAITVINNNIGKLVQMGLNILLALLRGISNNIGQVVTTVTSIIVNLLSSIANNLGRIVTAGASILSNLIKGILNNLVSIPVAALNILNNFLNAIANNLGRVITAGLNIVAKLVNGIASRVGEVITAGTNLIVNFITGIGNAGSRIVAAGVNAMIKFVNAISKGSVRLVDAGMKAITNFLNGVATAINQNSGAMRAAGIRVGVAIVDGMTGGLLSKAGSLYSQIESIMGHAMSLMHKIPGIHSPSTVTYDIGENIILGLTNGLDENAKNVYASALGISNGVVATFKNAFQITSPSKVMYDLGKYVGEGFAQGLRGSSQDIDKVWKDLNDKLTEAMRTARETIITEQDKLDKLRETKKPDAEAIKQAQAIIDQNEAILVRSTLAHQALIGTLKAQRVELSQLSNEYDQVSGTLKNAQDILAGVIKTRDDAIIAYRDQFASLPEIVQQDPEGAAVDQLKAYEDALTHQVAAVGAYSSTLDQLRKLGLDDATYQKLLQEGTADQQFATQLLSGGKTAVDGLNTLDKQLTKVSATLAVNSANNLYQAGVDSAQGLVNGLKSKQDHIKSTMSTIAKEIVNTLKKELKIKSPSEVMFDIGAFAMDGFAKGIFDNIGIMKNAIPDAVDEAMATLKESIKKSTKDNMGLNLQPVIAPIYDPTKLVQAGKAFADIGTASFAQASTISTQQTANDQAAAPPPPSITFNQTNTSPDALSEVEIYRQTKNQLSQLKSVLAV